jgi:DNA-damage-inducible protein D
LGKEGSQLVSNCYQLKMTAEDGKQRMTDVATPETLLRLIQSVTSPKAEPIKSKPISRNAATMQLNAKPNRYFQINQCRFW